MIKNESLLLLLLPVCGELSSMENNNSGIKITFFDVNSNLQTLPLTSFYPSLVKHDYSNIHKNILPELEKLSGELHNMPKKLLPSAKEIAFRLHHLELDHFTEKTGIHVLLGGTQKHPIEVVAAVDLAINHYDKCIKNEYDKYIENENGECIDKEVLLKTMRLSQATMRLNQERIISAILYDEKDEEEKQKLHETINNLFEEMDKAKNMPPRQPIIYPFKLVPPEDSEWMKRWKAEMNERLKDKTFEDLLRMDKDYGKFVRLEEVIVNGETRYKIIYT